MSMDTLHGRCCLEQPKSAGFHGNSHCNQKPALCEQCHKSGVVCSMQQDLQKSNLQTCVKDVRLGLI